MPPQGIVAYNKDSGFKVKIERLYNCKKKSAWKQINKVIFCTNPPGGWYSDPKVTNDVYFTTRHDWKSGTASQKYLDDWTTITGNVLDHNSILIIEVKACSLKNGKKKTDPQELKLDDIGWTVLPLYDTGSILSGYYQLPLYSGVPPPAFIADSQTEEAEKILEKCLENAKDAKAAYKKNIKLCDGYPQILIKIIDRYGYGVDFRSFFCSFVTLIFVICFLNSLMLDMESNLFGTLAPIYLPRGKESKYKYEKNVIIKDAAKDPLSKRITKKTKAADHIKLINRLFAAETKIDHYDLDNIANMKDDAPDDKSVKKAKSKKK